MAWSTNGIFKLYNRVVSSIAFYPTLITTGFLFLSLLIIFAEFIPWSIGLRDELSLVLVKDRENARLILGTLVGGTISLTVFSFSMVMVVLNRASATLSPRVIPGLVTQKRHQQILGFYVGTIVYVLLLMINIGEDGGPGRLPSLGILLGMVFGVTCLAFFVYFIHSISRAIQVDAILQSIYKVALKKLVERDDKLKDMKPKPQWPEDRDWVELTANRSGYFKSTNTARLTKLLERHGVRATIQVLKGSFVIPDCVLLKIERDIHRDAQDELRACFFYYVEEYADEHYFFGFRQLSEVAIKSLSPGINDPGTAIKAIDMLSVLCSRFMALPEFDVARDSGGIFRAYYREHNFHELLYEIMTPIRTYGERDPCVMLRLLEAYRNILHMSPSVRHREVVLEHARSLVEAIDARIANSSDRQEINGAIVRINALIDSDNRLLSLA